MSGSVLLLFVVKSVSSFSTLGVVPFFCVRMELVMVVRSSSVTLQYAAMACWCARIPRSASLLSFCLRSVLKSLPSTWLASRCTMCRQMALNLVISSCRVGRAVAVRRWPCPNFFFPLGVVCLWVARDAACGFFTQLPCTDLAWLVPKRAKSSSHVMPPLPPSFSVGGHFRSQMKWWMSV